MKRWFSLAVAMLLLWSVIPAASAESTGVTVTDMEGREIQLDAPAERIVALTAADCEILCALGCADALVGRGEYCDYPAEVLDVPCVQSGAETNIEQIIALHPQVLLMSTMAQTVEQVEMLESAGIRVVTSNAHDLEGVYTSIGMIGKLMGKEAEADAIIAEMQSSFDSIRSTAAESGKTVYFEVSPLQWGLWTAGHGTFMDEIATMCGLTNIFNDLEDWQPVSEDQVIERNPDYIVTITMYYGEGPTPVEEIMSRPGWETINAVQNGNVLTMDNDVLSRPGPRLKDGALTLFELTAPQEAAPAA